MQFKNYFKVQMPVLALTAIAFVFTSCGSYQSVSDDNDGIYNSTQQPVEYTESVAQNNNKSYYKNYFQEQSSEYDYITDEDEIFTDIDSYEGKYVEQDTIEQKSNAGWGQDNNDVTINVYGGGFGYFNHGWNSAWRWQNGFGYYGISPYWNSGWGWGYAGFYDPFWCPPYYGGFYGYGYGYYGSPYWNNWNNYGYNNYYGRNRVAYHNSRRGSNLNRLNALGRRNTAISRSRVRSNAITPRSRVRTATSTPRPRVSATPRSSTPRSSTSTATQPRPRSTNSISTRPKRSSTATTPRPRRTNTTTTPRPRRTNTSSAPRTRSNTYSRPSRSSGSRSSAPSRRRR